MRRRRKIKKLTYEEFERNMDALENGEAIPIYEILKVDPKNYPPPQFLKLKKVKRKFRKLKRILEKNSFVLELQEDVPELDAYRYLTETLLFEKETVHLAKGTFCHITGCTGYCEKCFQSSFCEINSEI